MESLNIFIRSIFIDNMVFAFFFGMCSYIAVSKSVKTALGLGLAVTFVMVMTVPLNYLLYEYVLKADVLVPGVDLSFLTFIVFIATIAAFVQLVEMAVEKFSPTLYNQMCIRDSTYIIVYSTVMVVIVATLLAVASLSLQKRQAENELQEKKSNILQSLGYSPDENPQEFDRALADFDNQVKSFVLDADGVKTETPSKAVSYTHLIGIEWILYRF